MIRFAQAIAVVATSNALTFSQPVRFSDALQSREVRSVLPTTLGSADFDALLEASRGGSAQILERATFSAKTTSAEYLDEWDRLLDRYLRGGLDRATFRLLAKQKLDAIGYRPEPSEEGSLTDLSSDTRINLRIAMDAQFAHGYGSWLHDQNPVVLDQWPAQELYRAAAAKAPRDWHSRWSDAGGEFFNGRMIALRNDPIWTNISRFGLPYPPFDYGSHMRTRLVDRNTAIELGLIDRDTQIPPQDRGFNDDLQYSPEIRSKALRQALVESDDRLEFVGDVLTIK